MQKLIFVLIIAGAYAAPSLRGGEEIDWFTCPAEVESGCSGATQCLYPNPRDCHSYIQCNEVGTSWVRPCASSNLVWNNTKKECDWPTNSQCIVELATSETTTAEPITKPSTAAPSSCVDQQVDWFTCPDEVANGCTGPKDCLYPNPRDCHTFIQCNEIKTAWVKCCAPSDPPLVWNDTKKECDWPSSSQCIVGPTTPEPTTAAPTTAAPTTAAPTTAAPTTAAPSSCVDQQVDWFTCPDEVANGCTGPKDCLYPNPRDCHTFIQCNEIKTAWVKCCAPSDPPLVWNDTKKECDWPSSSQCIVGPTTPEPTTAAPTTAAPTTAAPTTAAPTTAAPTTAAPSSCVDQQVDWFTCPDEVANGCTGPKDCLYPNPRDCHTFIQCNEIKTAWVKCCAPSDPPLVWNDTKKECDWPSSSQCIVGPTTPEPTTAKPTTEPSTAAPTTAAPTTAAPTTAAPTTAAPTTAAPTTAAPTTAAPSSCVDQQVDWFTCPDEVANGCTGPKDCLYPNPRDCHTFIQCNEIKTAWVKCCAPSDPPLVWNDTKKECDWPSSSQCIVGPTTPEPTTAKPTTEPSTAAPTTAAPTTAAPTTAAPTTAAPTTAEPSTAAPTTGPTEGPTTTEQNEIPTETPTEGPASSTTSAPVSTTPNSCGDDDSADADLDLAKLCAGCSEKRLVANPNSQKRYIECNGGADGKTNSVQRCSEGLLFSADRLTCDYAGLVNDKGPSK